jgi:hypothetical protein
MPNAERWTLASRSAFGSVQMLVHRRLSAVHLIDVGVTASESGAR